MSRYLSLDDSIKLSLHVYIHQYMMLINAVPRNVKTIIGKYVVTSVKSPQLVSWYGVRFEAVISARMSIRGHFPASISFRRIRYWYRRREALPPPCFWRLDTAFQEAHSVWWPRKCTQQPSQQGWE
jgi:hypothetical protein